MLQNTRNNENLISAYWTLIKQLNLLPNWWMSAEYIDKSGLVETKTGPLEGFKSPDGCGWFFPPLYNSQRFEFSDEIFCGFLYEEEDEQSNHNFLDFQFIYSPKQFVSLQGSRWQIFRKNIRKYPKRCGGKIEYKKVEHIQHSKEVANLLIQWSANRKLFDPKTITTFALKGQHRWGLFNNGCLVGLNVHDENPIFINYRYCIDDGTPFLNEYLRHRFYTNPIVLAANKLVNDGGCLGSETLKKFKLKLNPTKIYKVFSYEKRTI